MCERAQHEREKKRIQWIQKKFLQKLHYYVSLHNIVVFCKKKKKQLYIIGWEPFFVNICYNILDFNQNSVLYHRLGMLLNLPVT